MDQIPSSMNLTNALAFTSVPRSIPAFCLGPVSSLGFGTALLPQQLGRKEGPSLRGIMLSLSRGAARSIPLCPRMNLWEKMHLRRRSGLRKGGGGCWWPRVARPPNSAHLIGVRGPGKPLLLPCRCSLCHSTTHWGRVGSEHPWVLCRFMRLHQESCPLPTAPGVGQQ